MMFQNRGAFQNRLIFMQNCSFNSFYFFLLTIFNICRIWILPSLKWHHCYQNSKPVSQTPSHWTPGHTYHLVNEYISRNLIFISAALLEVLIWLLKKQGERVRQCLSLSYLYGTRYQWIVHLISCNIPDWYLDRKLLIVGGLFKIRRGKEAEVPQHRKQSWSWQWGEEKWNAGHAESLVREKMKALIKKHGENKVRLGFRLGIRDTSEVHVSAKRTGANRLHLSMVTVLKK